VHYLLRPAEQAADGRLELRQISCFDCGTDLAVPATALSTMCKLCSAHVDLSDYTVASSAARNFKTKGRLTVEAKGFLFNSDSIVGVAVVKGKFIGKLTTERDLVLHPSSEFRGTFKAGKLVIPVDTHFRWREELHVGEAEIAGEVLANLRADRTVRLLSSARFFGDVSAGNLIVENGAVFVGRMRVGSSEPPGGNTMPPSFTPVAA
jgi:cytoskeletal protein CcmA (bactofilin family)